MNGFLPDYSTQNRPRRIDPRQTALQKASTDTRLGPAMQKVAAMSASGLGGEALDPLDKLLVGQEAKRELEQQQLSAKQSMAQAVQPQQPQQPVAQVPVPAHVQMANNWRNRRSAGTNFFPGY